MIPYRKEKLLNAICFFAIEHHKKTSKPLYQTYLYKYLALLEFKSIEETGRPVFGLTYIAMDKGPVPIELYNKREDIDTEFFRFKDQGDGKFIIIPKIKSANLDYFSPYEIEQMRRLIEIYANRFVFSSEMSEASHQEIKAWQKAWRAQPNSIIDYDFCFDENIKEKREAELSDAEENYLLYKTFEELERIG